MGGDVGVSASDRPLRVELGGREFTVEDLAHVNRMMTVGLVLPNAAHEINNALQVVSGLVEMLGARDDVPAAVHEKLGRIATQVARATGLVRELVAFARRDQAVVGRVDVARVVEAALAMRRYHLSRDRVKVTTSLAGDPPALCHVDGHYLQQAVVNLVLNAEQALQGRPDPQLHLAIEPGPGEVVVVVEDNGAGLRGDALARAGEPFFSTAASRTLGLGLAVTRAIAELHGGTLTLEPAPGRGTRACIRLPRA
jgi:two-component system C4-dicarboxylate transport sensor histidine kinase DctB